MSRSTTSRASAAVSTCGMTMPSAPLSSARVAIAYSPFGHARDRRDAGVERGGRDLRAGFERHHAMLHVEKQPVEAGRRPSPWRSRRCASCGCRRPATIGLARAFRARHCERWRIIGVLPQFPSGGMSQRALPRGPPQAAGGHRCCDDRGCNEARAAALNSAKFGRIAQRSGRQHSAGSAGRIEARAQEEPTMSAVAQRYNVGGVYLLDGRSRSAGSAISASISTRSTGGPRVLRRPPRLQGLRPRSISRARRGSRRTPTSATRSGYFMRYGTDHHALVLFPKQVMDHRADRKFAARGHDQPDHLAMRQPAARSPTRT